MAAVPARAGAAECWQRSRVVQAQSEEDARAPPPARRRQRDRAGRSEIRRPAAAGGCGGACAAAAGPGRTPGLAGGEHASRARSGSLPPPMRALAAERPGLLTIIAPRHPERGAAIAAELGGVARRGAGEGPPAGGDLAGRHAGRARAVLSPGRDRVRGQQPGGGRAGRTRWNRRGSAAPWRSGRIPATSPMPCRALQAAGGLVARRGCGAARGLGRRDARRSRARGRRRAGRRSRPPGATPSCRRATAALLRALMERR